MYHGKMQKDSLSRPVIRMYARQLLGTVCVCGGARCPLINARCARKILDRVKSDPTVAIQLNSAAESRPHFRRLTAEDYRDTKPDHILNHKRDLDVLQRLGLVPGDIRRARYLYTLLLNRIETPLGICAYDTSGWEGCPLARSGAYEKVRAAGWQAMVYCRSDREREEYRQQSAKEVMTADCLCIRPHHLMCLSCWYAGGKGQSPRPNDTLYEILQRMRQDPEVPIRLVEGPCMACDCCDGFHPETGRCVHDGGLIRDYKKDLDVFQKLGLMPGATLPAKDLMNLLFERIPSTRDICGYGDGIVRSREWFICGDPDGNPGYAVTREKGIF